MMTKNKFNTTPNGNTIVDINEIMDLSSTMIIDPQMTPYIDNIIYLNPTITNFILKPGNYYITSVFKILTDNIKIIGFTGNAADVHIYQKSVLDGISIRGNNIVLQNITVHCKYSLKVCLTVASAKNTIVAGCHFFGCDDHFCVFYAGPSDLIEGQNTLDAYNNYYLDEGNIFYNNIIYTSYSGDSLSFSLQHESQMVGNIIRGGKVAIYMCRATNVYNNVLADSTTNGFYISLPSDNLAVIGNKIYNANYSGIKISNQMEHGIFQPYYYNIMIKHNTIYGSKIYGIELNYCSGINITNNNIVSDQMMGIYSYGSKNIQIRNNKISYFRYATFFERTDNSTIDSNIITSIFPYLGQNGIKVVQDDATINNTIVGNKMRGEYQYDLIVGGDPSNTVGTNTTEQFYDIIAEKNIYVVQ